MSVVFSVVISTAILLVLSSYMRFRTTTGLLHGFDVKKAAKRREQYTNNARSLLTSGYLKFKDQIFGVDTHQGIKWILPPRLIEEISNHPNMSFQSSLDEDLLIDYTMMGGVKSEALSFFKKNVITNLGQFIPEFQDLIEEYLHEMMGDPKDWSPTNMYPIMLRILGILTARVMMGTSAPHDKHWVTLTTDYVLSGINYRIVQKQLDGGRKIIAQAVKEAKEQDSEGLPPPKPPHVMWEFSREPQASTQKAIDRYLREQMNLAVGGIHTTSSVATQTIFQLVAHPEFIPILRREVVEATERCGGKLDKAALWSMSRLDSFIRETHRLASPNLTTLQRRVLVGTTLSDGTFLPKGSKLEFATHAIHRDEAYFQNGESFDGLRFFRMRQEDPGAKQHYVTAKNDYLGWGIGRSACPGRFLADVEIKLLIAYILLHYDLKAPENNAQRRHIEFENQVFPDPVTPILIKRFEE
ncbi:hypothetical protein E8E14_004686 [Neopestalotiopsis sp. 37M]|nr:hypothetical protein E8E14_004686 [Neopestalotiopsis sp. 37M]